MALFCFVINNGIFVRTKCEGAGTKTHPSGRRGHVEGAVSFPTLKVWSPESKGVLLRHTVIQDMSKIQTMKIGLKKDLS